MVGLVLVSHSRRLAEGAAELLRGLAADVNVQVAAGDSDGGLGTDGDAVAASIAAADSGDGVVVIADLGSAILSVRAVLEDTGGVEVRLADAPFVEGAVAASVTASIGSPLGDVLAAAEGAWDERKL
jgi:phosphoenolpyruvate---glycerone phosphotransferase subunit DhaM